MKRGTPRHPKMYALANAIKEPLRSAVGIMEMLWHFAGTNTPEGDIGRLTDLEIAAAVGWDKRPEKLLEALVATRWLDRSERYRLIIHDWPDHCDQAVRKTLLYRRLNFLDVYGDEKSPILLPDAPDITLPEHPDVSPEKREDKHPPSGTAKATAKAFEETTNTEKPSAKKKRSRSEATPEFEEFYGAFWVKKAWQDALNAYEKHVTTPDMHFVVMKAVELQTPEMMARDPSKRPYPATWLNGQRWKDEISEPPMPAKSKFELMMERA